jgi:hypothetical protein
MGESTTCGRGVFSLLGVSVLIAQSVLLLAMYLQASGDAFSVLDPDQGPTLTAVPTQSGPKPAPTTLASKQKMNILSDRSSPIVVELLSVDHPGIRQRHECIAKIRARHEQLLAPLVTPSAGHPHALLVDPAYHENVGDSMLTFAEHAFL